VGLVSQWSAKHDHQERENRVGHHHYPRGIRQDWRMPIDHLLRTVPALKDSVEKAEKVGEADNRHGRAHVRKVHHFKSDLSVEGRQETIHIVVREMDNGRMFYDLNLGGNVGARTEGPMGARDLRVEPELQISPNTLNISIGGAFDNLSVPSSILSSVSDVVGQILRAHGLDCAVSPSEVRSTSGVPVLGSYRGGEIKASAGATDPGHVVRHEIIHALRDANLWGQPHGLFTGQEWRALVGAYGDLDAAGQVKKMDADFYADWSADRAKYPPGPILRALERIHTFFCVLGAALRGEGFIDAAMARLAAVFRTAVARFVEAKQARISATCLA
jgi:hypothetical protein